MSLSVDLTVIIVSHNHGPYLEACLNALAPERHAIGIEVLVVDNVSTDETVEVVRRRGWVKLIQNKQRLGFAANNNRAIRAGAGQYVMLLNPDTVAQENALEQLLAYMEANPRVGICGPQLIFPDGRIQPSCRRFPTLASVIARRTPFRRWLWNSALNARHLMSDFDHARTSEVDWMLGACLLTRRQFLQTVGLMDEGFYLYVEDIDWCYRAHQAGWQVVYLAEARIVHYHLAESDRALWSRHSWLHLQSMWRFYRKHLAPPGLRLIVKHEVAL